MRAIILVALLATAPLAAEAGGARYSGECDNCSNQSSSLTSKDAAGLAGRTWFKAVSGKDYWDARTEGKVVTAKGKDIITYSRNKGADDHAQANATPGNYSTGGDWAD